MVQLTVIEAARRRGVGMDSIYKDLWVGRIKGTKLDGKWVVDGDSLQKLIDKKKKPTPKNP
jgi:hypothetical protein